MAIVGSTAGFPQNVVEVLVPRLLTIDSGIMVLRRGLRADDPVQCIGVYCESITPNENSYEMKGIGGPSFPSLSTYRYIIHGFNKHTDQTEGISVSAELADRLRDMLCDDDVLRIQLSALNLLRSNGKRKRLNRYSIKDTRLLQNDLPGGGTWYFLSVTTLDVEVETA